MIEFYLGCRSVAALLQQRGRRTLQADFDIGQSHGVHCSRTEARRSHRAELREDALIAPGDCQFAVSARPCPIAGYRQRAQGAVGPSPVPRCTIAIRKSIIGKLQMKHTEDFFAVTRGTSQCRHTSQLMMAFKGRRRKH